MKKAIKVTGVLVLVLILTVVFQVRGAIKESDKVRNEELKSWAKGDTVKQNELEDYKLKCENREYSNDEFVEAMEAKKDSADLPSFSTVTCARELGYDGLADAIEGVDYSSVKIPFPLSLIDDNG